MVSILSLGHWLLDLDRRCDRLLDRFDAVLGNLNIQKATLLDFIHVDAGALGAAHEFRASKLIVRVAVNPQYDSLRQNQMAGISVARFEYSFDNQIALAFFGRDLTKPANLALKDSADLILTIACKKKKDLMVLACVFSCFGTRRNGVQVCKSC